MKGNLLQIQINVPYVFMNNTDVSSCNTFALYVKSCHFD